jgi:hypothetical protein
LSVWFSNRVSNALNPEPPSSIPDGTLLILPTTWPSWRFPRLRSTVRRRKPLKIS